MCTTAVYLLATIVAGRCLKLCRMAFRERGVEIPDEVCST